jgi:hypothetical protein
VTPDNTHFDENNLIWSSTATPTFPELDSYNKNKQPTDFYTLDMGYITTSFCDGTVVVHYKAIPTDSDGLPLIPDNENYKQALYWYVRAMMIGSGFKDPVFDEKEMMQRFEAYAARAINEVSYPSPDQKEQQLKLHVRFIPPANYWENFFRVDQAEKNYDV